jgi:hypothetical protein
MILWAVSSDPDKRWSRMAIQQAAWGERVSEGGLKRRCSGFSRPVRNITWWRTDMDGERRENYDSTFGRAIRSLERRGLLVRRQEPGCHPSWMLTASGLSEAQKLAPGS